MTGFREGRVRITPPSAGTHTGAPSDRWTSWARALTERHTRISSRHGALTHMLAQAPARHFLRSQRWEQAAWMLEPQIHLAIAPLLRILTLNGSASQAPSQTRNDWLQVVQIVPEYRPPQPIASTQAQPPAPDRLPITVETRWTALDRVLNRSMRHETITHLGQTLITTEGAQVLRRFVETLQRVEERRQGSNVTWHPRETFVAHEDSAGFDTPVRSLQSARRGGEFSASRHGPDADRSSPAAFSPPAVNIAHLADEVMQQLDHRLIAYRERLGKGV